MQTGEEFIVEAIQCDSKRLASLFCVRSLCDRMVVELGLVVVGTPQWHTFPFPGGVTGLYLLTESHLACHTFPEYALATFNLYCCRPRIRWPWEERLAEHLGATRVNVRRLVRGDELARGEEPGDESANSGNSLTGWHIAGVDS